MEVSPDKAVRLPTFDGKSENFQVWFLRFKAYAAVHNFEAALGDKAEASLPAKESDPIDEEESG